MIIENLSVTNFRAFKGCHRFDLSPRKRWNSARPVVLFGGLNGTGKTTILTAIRLVLYGKYSLDHSVSLRRYHEYLRNSVHASKDKSSQPDHASIEMNFYYSHMGVKNHYQVVRSWITRSKGKVNEQLDINKDGAYLGKLNGGQKQGLLNELVPVGVSDLFFFDGERIADLATDKSGTVLSDSIKKLLGLDLIERLSSDLATIIRSHNHEAVDSKTRSKLKDLEMKLNKKDDAAKNAEEEYRQLIPQLIERKVLYEFEEREFLAKGGGWAVARDQLIEHRNGLESKRNLVQQEVREILAGPYPISLATDFCTATLLQLAREHEASEQILVKTAKTEVLKDVQKKLKKTLDSAQYAKASVAINQTLNETASRQDVKYVHNIGERPSADLTVMCKEANSSKKQLQKLILQLVDLNAEIEEASLNITRAPEENTIEKVIKKLNKLRDQVAETALRCGQAQTRAKTLLKEAADIAREADKRHLDVSYLAEANRVALMARGASALLGEYIVISSKKKVVKLETAFNASFARLARKEDLHLSAKIDPQSFRINLKSVSGKTIDKNDLSAGERQIYAIAMLESIAKTSGRKLPIIIDTPLGRLDSKHRKKLLESYFPTASHQVIILSTDTEVDEAFYSDLYKHMSHAYELKYDAVSGSTHVREGYFWKIRAKENKVA